MNGFNKILAALLVVLFAVNAFAQAEDMCGDGICGDSENTDNCQLDCYAQPTGFFGLGDAGNMGALAALAIIAIGFAVYIIRRK
ncbi:MAG: hypothetical protein V1493_06795 [Candidatus Diapherotrites archaeon]